MDSKTPVADEVVAYGLQRVAGTAYWGDMPFDVTALTQLDVHFWQGVSPSMVRLPLPAYFKHVLNLYVWGAYEVPKGTEIRSVKLADGSLAPDAAILEDLAAWVASAKEDGPTLVHCQVGLNRSSLVSGLVLMRTHGMTAADAIKMIRKERSPAALCNPAFEQWLRRA